MWYDFLNLRLVEIVYHGVYSFQLYAHKLSNKIIAGLNTSCENL